MDTNKLKALLTLDEESRLQPYVDTVGNITIGIGHNLSADGISHAVQDLMYQEDVAKAKAIVARMLPNWETFTDARQAVFLGLAFNLGTKLGMFTVLLKCALLGDWQGAAVAITQSLWWRQVGSRGPRYRQMLLTGDWPPSLCQ